MKRLNKLVSQMFALLYVLSVLRQSFGFSLHSLQLILSAGTCGGRRHSADYNFIVLEDNEPILVTFKIVYRFSRIWSAGLGVGDGLGRTASQTILGYI